MQIGETRERAPREGGFRGNRRGRGGRGREGKKGNQGEFRFNPDDFPEME